MKIRIRKAAVVAALALPLALGACSSGTDAAPTGAGTSATTAAESGPFNAAAGQEVDKDAFMDQTHAAMMDAKTYAMTMTMAMGGQNVTIKGVGDMSDEKNLKVRMSMEGAAQGMGALNMLLIGQKMYMQLPGQAGGKYVEMPLEQLTQAGGQDIQKLLNPAESLRMSKDAVQKVTYVGEEDVSGEKLRHYTMVLDLAKANQAAGVTAAPTPTGAQTVPYDVWVDGDKRIRKLDMTVEGTKVAMTLDKYGEPVDIVAPPSASITTMPGLPTG